MFVTVFVLFCRINKIDDDKINEGKSVDPYIWLCTIRTVRCTVLYRDYLALNVYIAQCYFKLNYYDMCQVRAQPCYQALRATLGYLLSEFRLSVVRL